MAGIAPLPVVPWTMALFGIGIVLATIQREVRSERRGTTILIVTLGVLVLILALGVFLPMWDLAAVARGGSGAR